MIAHFHAAFVLALLAFAGTAALAQSCPTTGGCLDPSFGNGNLVRVENAGDHAGPITRQGNGQLLALATGSHISKGQFLTRLNVDGTVDTSFAGDGTKEFLWRLVKGRDTYYGSVRGLGIQIVGGSERILVAGSTPIQAGNKVLANRLRVDRFYPNGSPDLSWGTNGTLLLNVNGATSLLVQPSDQKIVIGTGNMNQIIRLTANGQFDTEFGSGGIASSTYPQVLHLDAAGRILAAGWVNTAPNRGGTIITPSVTRHLPDGKRDTSFATNGTAIAGFNTSYIYPSVTTDALGNVIISSSIGSTNSNTDMAVQRFTESGVADTTFSDDGIATFDFGGRRDLATASAPLSDGSIVVVGNTVAVGSTAGADLAVVRFGPSGDPDAGFGSGGGFVFPHVTGSNFGAILVAADQTCTTSDGFTYTCEKFYASGAASQTGELLVARFLAW